MVAIKLAGMSSKELKQLIADAQAALKTRGDADKAEALRKAKAIAGEYGFSLVELIEGRLKDERPSRPKKADKRTKVKPKYAHPENGRQTWSGRGSVPQWLLELEAGGESRDAFLIRKRNSD